jgi:hypothetical protein
MQDLAKRVLEECALANSLRHEVAELRYDRLKAIERLDAEIARLTADLDALRLAVGE